MKAKPLLKLTGNLGFVFGLYALSGPIGVKTYFIGSAIGYHLYASRNSKFKTIPLEKFQKKEKSKQVSLVLDWGKKR